MANEQYIVPVAVIERDQKLLLVFKHTSSAVACTNKWELPGGRAKFGQTVEEAVTSKTKQLLGIDVTPDKMLDRIYSTVSDRTDGDGQVQCYIMPIHCDTEATEFTVDQ